jgi:prepilin-type N-terminal cleavage/methylation domain-containing protein/prepilin-type processing-associated H-X9-DG protein
MRATENHLKRIAAFTLVELLVVVAVVAILAALLAPAIKGARDTAKDLKCLSTIRQIGLGIQMRANENEGWASDGIGTSPDWWTPVTPYIGGHGEWINVGSYTPSVYEKRRGCPYMTTGSWGWWVYGMNQYFGLTNPSYPLTKVKDPAGTYLISDLGLSYCNTPSHLVNAVTGIPNGSGSKPRHRSKGLNFYFVDGHAKLMTYPDAVAYSWTIFGTFY